MQQKVTDLLAMDRTKLANERTFLAYFRTFIAFLSTGFVILRLELLQDIFLVGYTFLIIAPILFIIGFLRFFFIKKRLKRYFQAQKE